ncbi:pyridoxal phosphate-dependent aminotransferase [Dickeya fangzhongdai]|uniref:MalY/PatB family protein n=1 Tax=Dickeya fangzhongdai TaxID=1778540 RepID=UPI00136D10F2|nr:MalY/PatB family protein [Dickeya fangzhongdai]UMB75656.1 pyridoxal phosphate-dependent aminotransferase [Dickeya fangzhongdai]
MTCRFDEVIDFSHSHLLKWEYPSPYLPHPASRPPLPLWIADMDFRCPDEVQQALHDAINQGVFGYTRASETLFDAIIQWQWHHHGWRIHEDWIVQSPGVVNSLSMIVQTFTQPGEGVLIQPPVYGPFYHSVTMNDRQVVTAPLTETASGYTLDLDAFEQAITPTTRLFFLCNPHNPTGHVWSRDELLAMGNICRRHGVMVVSDEIHQDLIINPAKRHQPFAGINDEFADHSITCTSPSKTFNLAGLHTSNLFIPNKTIRDALKRTYARCSLYIPNMLGLTACEAAYRHGGPWLSALLDYLRDNRALLQANLGPDSPVRLFDADALYLGWLDFRESGIAPADLPATLLNQAGLWLDDGAKFGAAYAGFARINFACRRALLHSALAKLADMFTARRKTGGLV